MIRQRLRSFGGSKKDNEEFKIEIYESKRKPTATTPRDVVPSINVSGESSGDAKVNKASESKSKSLGLGPGDNNADRDMCSDDQQVVIEPNDAISPCSELTTPESSADNTLAVTLDVSQAIREETDESDRFSPLKTPVDIRKEPAKGK